MTRKIIWATIMVAIAAIIQSTLLVKIEFLHTIPDLTLIILVYVAYINGAMTGQITGFTSGIIIDLISAAPLGSNGFIRVVIGFITGLFKGSFFLDIIILPVILTIIATLMKAFLAWILHFLFSGNVPCYDLYTSVFWIELCYSAFAAPFVFAFMKLFKTVFKPRQEN